MLRSFFNGFILNIQFFSTIPFRKKEVPIIPINIRRAVQLFPILGLLQGVLLAALYYALAEWTFFSPVAIAFCLWLTIIIITGAIHLDGWIDSCDAFFSYRDKKRRIEILADPQIGAFGLIGTIVLLSARFLFIYETVNMTTSFTFLLIILIPFLGKIIMGMLITFVQPVKKEGLGYLFHEASSRSILIYYLIYVITIFAILMYIQIDIIFIALIMLTVTVITYIIARGKSIAWFGGMNGDIVGGATEGTETILWLTIWLYHYFAMGLH